MIGGSQEGRPLFSQHETACCRAEAQETQRAEPPAEASPDQYDFSHVGSRRFMSLLTRRAPAISASSCEGSIWRLATGYSGRIVTTLPSAHGDRVPPTAGGARASNAPPISVGLTSNGAADYTLQTRRLSSSLVLPSFSTGNEGNSVPDDRTNGPEQAASEGNKTSARYAICQAEEEVRSLLEASVTAANEGKSHEALGAGIQAVKKERHLRKLLRRHQQERQTSTSSGEAHLLQRHDPELTFAVVLNLANRHQACQNFPEAISAYGSLMRQYRNTAETSAFVRVNIGNIYLAQGRHGEALKMYHIALDSTPANSNFLRCKLLKTIGDAYFLAGKFTEATATYEQLLKVRAQLGWSVSAFLPRGLRGPSRCVSVESESLNLLLCYYAAGNKAKMQEHFLHMLVMQDDMSGTDELVEDDEDDDEDQLSPSSMSPLIVAAQSASFCGASSCCPFPDNSPNHGAACSPPSSQNSSSSGADLSPASGEPDGFTQLICQRRKQTYRRLVLAGGLIAQALAGNVTGSLAANLQSAFDWVIECFRSHGYRELAYEIEMHKANALLRLKCGVDTAVKIYRSFEHVERHHAVLTPRASTNLSFIYILENDLPQATKYADIALSADRYNAHALVNKGCCLLLAGKRQEARHHFLEALGLDAECVEALYNFGLACKIDDQLDEALEAFSRFNQILPSQPEVLYHLGDISESMGQYEKTMEWFSLLTSPGVRPTDARILGRMGAAAAAHSQDDEDKQALHYFLSSYSYYPYSVDVITWLGVYFVKQQLFDKAAEFFHRAAALQPAEPKWLLMVASCYRRSENFPLALALYKKVHREHPADVECLRCLVTVCKEMRIPDDQYAALLRKAENAQQIIYGLQPRGASSARLEERQPIVQSGRTTQIRSLGARQKTLALTDGAAPEEDMAIIENLVF